MSYENLIPGKVMLCPGDSRHVLRDTPDNRYDSIVCDPPYALGSIMKRFGSPNAAPAKGNDAYMRASAGFMGKKWDTGEAAHDAAFWAEALRVLKPGGHLVAFSGTRTYHRMACAIEDAGFEIRDSLMWVYGSGFPKSHDVSKGIDRAAGAEREIIGPKVYADGTKGHWGLSDKYAQDAHTKTLDGNAVKFESAPATSAAREWQGWGTALKPAFEPIVLARKPLSEGTVAANVLKWGTGALNIDGCRVGTEGGTVYGGKREGANDKTVTAYGNGLNAKTAIAVDGLGRWPANVCHDGSDEVAGMFPETGSGGFPAARGLGGISNNGHKGQCDLKAGRTDSGSAARFFYSSKADSNDRLGSSHPTVKPVDLMQWLVRLVTPKGGLILDPFAGTGTTGEAALREGMRAMLIERQAEYQADIRRRMKLVMSGPDERARESIKAKLAGKPIDLGPLFATGDADAERP